MASSFLVLDIETVPDSTLWTPPPPEPDRLKLEKKPTKGELEFLPAVLDLLSSNKAVHVEDLRKALDIAERAEDMAATTALRLITSPEEEEKPAFAPLHAHKVIVIGCVWIDPTHTVRKLGTMTIDEKGGGEAKLLDEWNAFMNEKKPTIVSWYGRGFDLPVLMYRSFKSGIPMSWYFDQKDYRYRYSEDLNADLCDVMGDYGAVRGGLKLDQFAKLIGLPGKHGRSEGEKPVEGSQVGDLYAQGKLDEIAAYCLSDVAQTAFVFLRWRYLKGRLSLEGYRGAVSSLLNHVENNDDTKYLRSLIDDKALLLSEISP